MDKYCQEVDINDPETTHVKLINLTGSNKKVLEIGCANGRMSKYLQKNGCQVIGIEIDKKKAEMANKFCEEAITGNIEEEATLLSIKSTFDVIIFGDVLEHLTNPHKTLASVSRFLKKDGYVLVSLPNIAYFTVRMKLLFGKFEYNPEGGIMDKEHLRHFTLKTSKEMFRQSGYEIEHMDALSVPRFKKNQFIYSALKKIPSLFGYEFIFKLRLRAT